MSTTPEPPLDATREASELDCTGLLCPLPVYKAALVLDKQEPRSHLRLITTDPGALQDIPAMARQRGDTLVSVEDLDGRQTFLIQKGGQP